MKKVIFIAVLLASTLTFAQQRGSGKMGENAPMNQKESFTPEQQAELQVKRMTLHLDLTTKQQEEIKKIVLENTKKRDAKRAEMQAKKEEGKQPTSEERFAMQNQRLDNQIAMKAELKKILSKEQMEKWEAHQNDNLSKRNNKSKMRQGKGNQKK
jgi:protein CpxP